MSVKFLIILKLFWDDHSAWFKWNWSNTNNYLFLIIFCQELFIFFKLNGWSNLCKFARYIMIVDHRLLYHILFIFYYIPHFLQTLLWDDCMHIVRRQSFMLYFIIQGRSFKGDQSIMIASFTFLTHSITCSITYLFFLSYFIFCIEFCPLCIQYVPLPWRYLLCEIKSCV